MIHDILSKLSFKNLANHVAMNMYIWMPKVNEIQLPYVGVADHLEQQAVRERQMITKWDRSALEDKYIKMQEDNLLLKRHARKQEEKIKK